MKHIFIIGSKGIPAKYGGFETFVEKLTKGRESQDIKYHVACISNNKNQFEYNGARCFNVKVPNIGSARAVLYDIYALKECVKYIKKNNLSNSIIYILACRIGPFLNIYKKQLKRFDVKICVNPDGHEWKRSKWNLAIRKYWKISERLMVRHADLLVCDSKGIESYIKEDYKQYRPNTTFIAYGADIKKSRLDNESKKLVKWYEKFDIKKDNYYLIVGRFVPENNYKLIISEFMKSDTENDLVIISNVQENKLYKELLEDTRFDKDKRIKFVGTVYDEELLRKIRENAYAYIHGHEVGGTNPSLLEALSSTNLNLLLDVVFNKEVAGKGAIYFTKENTSLSNLINKVEKLNENELIKLGGLAKDRIKKYYTWDYIIKQYEDLFLNWSKIKEESV